jgi:hypothetical protein
MKLRRCRPNDVLYGEAPWCVAQRAGAAACACGAKCGESVPVKRAKAKFSNYSACRIYNILCASILSERRRSEVISKLSICPLNIAACNISRVGTT